MHVLVLAERRHVGAGGAGDDVRAGGPPMIIVRALIGSCSFVLFFLPYITFIVFNYYVVDTSATSHKQNACIDKQNACQ